MSLSSPLGGKGLSLMNLHVADKPHPDTQARKTSMAAFHSDCYVFEFISFKQQ